MWCGKHFYLCKYNIFLFVKGICRSRASLHFIVFYVLYLCMLGYEYDGAKHCYTLCNFEPSYIKDNHCERKHGNIFGLCSDSVSITRLLDVI